MMTEQTESMALCVQAEKMMEAAGDIGPYWYAVREANFKYNLIRLEHKTKDGWAFWRAVRYLQRNNGSFCSSSPLPISTEHKAREWILTEPHGFVRAKIPKGCSRAMAEKGLDAAIREMCLKTGSSLSDIMYGVGDEVWPQRMFYEKFDAEHAAELGYIPFHVFQAEHTAADDDDDQGGEEGVNDACAAAEENTGTEPEAETAAEDAADSAGQPAAEEPAQEVSNAICKPETEQVSAYAEADANEPEAEAVLRIYSAENGKYEFMPESEYAAQCWSPEYRHCMNCGLKWQCPSQSTGKRQDLSAKKPADTPWGCGLFVPQIFFFNPARDPAFAQHYDWLLTHNGAAPLAINRLYPHCSNCAFLRAAQTDTPYSELRSCALLTQISVMSGASSVVANAYSVGCKLYEPDNEAMRAWLATENAIIGYDTISVERALLPPVIPYLSQIYRDALADDVRAANAAADYEKEAKAIAEEDMQASRQEIVDAFGAELAGDAVAAIGEEDEGIPEPESAPLPALHFADADDDGGELFAELPDEPTPDDGEAAELTADGQRQLTQLAAEINVLTAQTAANLIAIGKRLIEAKRVCPHGTWGEWLQNNIQYTQKTANRLMLAAREYPDATPNLPAGKLYELLSLTAGERAEFMAAEHEVNGEHLTVESMTVRQLRQAIARRRAREIELESLVSRKNEALQQARGDATTAANRANKAEADLRLIKDALVENGEALAKADAKIKAYEAQPQDVITVETPMVPEDYETLKADKQALIDSKNALLDRQDELSEDLRKMRLLSGPIRQMLRAGACGQMPDADSFVSLVQEFMGQCGAMATNADYYALLPPAAIATYKGGIRMLQAFVAATIASMSGCLPDEWSEADAPMDD